MTTIHTVLVHREGPEFVVQVPALSTGAAQARTLVDVERAALDLIYVLTGEQDVKLIIDGPKQYRCPDGCGLITDDVGLQEHFANPWHARDHRQYRYGQFR